MNILQALDDPRVFGPFFKGTSWDAWRAFLASLFALPISHEQIAIYREHTGRTTPPTQPSPEAWLVCGRRSGKSFVLALVACFLACFRDWRPFLGPGEAATIMVIAADRKQARTILRYCIGLLREVPMLAPQIEGETQQASPAQQGHHRGSCRKLSLDTWILHRGCIAGRIGFFFDRRGLAEPDIEVINAVRPGMATIPGAMLLCASSPYARKGELWNAHRRHFGKDGDPVLCWHAPTRSMNPRVPQSVIDTAMARDPAHASAEFFASFAPISRASFSCRRSSVACRVASRRVPVCRPAATGRSLIRQVVRATRCPWRRAQGRRQGHHRPRR